MASTTSRVTSVPVDPLPPERFSELVGPARAKHIAEAGEQARQLLDGRVLWNINSTAAGGGVAEMLQVLLAYARGAGVDARWLVVGGEAKFFALTKRLHNRLHGTPGDGGALGDDERRCYEEVLAANAAELLELVRSDDVVLLHDPQTAGLAASLRDAGAIVVWRCHVGTNEHNQWTEEAWTFLRPYLQAVHAHVFSRQEYVPEGLAPVAIVPPSIDPFSPKNEDLAPGAVRSILVRAGLVAPTDVDAAPTFTRRDGTTEEVRRSANVIEDAPPPAGTPLVVQVSRWDRLKDMAGVMQGFATHVTGDAHLTLAGPSVDGVTDDPEGAQVLTECRQLWESLPGDVRPRVHLASLPMEDVEENAAMVNALQRHAAVVVQKSLVEGFGLTVAEAMWKARPVVASAIGGILDQIDDGETGILVHDPSDLSEFGAALNRLLGDLEGAARLGEAARRKVTAEFLGDRHLIQYVELLGQLLS